MKKPEKSKGLRYEKVNDFTTYEYIDGKLIRVKIDNICGKITNWMSPKTYEKYKDYTKEQWEDKMLEDLREINLK